MATIRAPGSLTTTKKRGTKILVVRNSPAMLEEICKDIQNGLTMGDTFNREDRPDYAGFTSWLEKDVERLRKFNAAKEMRAHTLASDCLEIADAVALGAPSVVDIMAAKLRVQTRQWYVSKFSPRVYGALQVQVAREQERSNEDAAAPQIINSPDNTPVDDE